MRSFTISIINNLLKKDYNMIDENLTLDITLIKIVIKTIMA